MIGWRWRLERILVTRSSAQRLGSLTSSVPVASGEDLDGDDGTGGHSAVADDDDDGDGTSDGPARSRGDRATAGRYGAQQRTATQYDTRRRRRLEVSASEPHGARVFM
jgi:hypothetical protein